MRLVLCDLDGVVWLAHRPIPGSVEAVAALLAGGVEVLFVTNNSVATVASHEAALARIGIDAGGAVVSSAQAAAQLVHAGERVMVGGGAGIVEAVTDRGAVAIDDTAPVAVDAVIVGMHRAFDYQRLSALAGAVRSGARFIATNHDPTYPTPDGPLPGGGSIVAAVATAAGAEPTFAGKPHRPMAELVAARMGASFEPAETVMVGDRKSTDGAFAATIGCRFVLVGSGVSADGEYADLATFVDRGTLRGWPSPRSSI